MIDDANTRLALASYMNNSMESVTNWATPVQVDKLQVTDNYNEQLVLCKFYSRKDPIVSGVIGKQVDLGFNSYKPRAKNCNDEEFLVYSSIDDLILSFSKQAAEEYLISGLVIPEITWKEVKGRDLELKGRPNKTYKIPDTIWIRDPGTIELKRTPIPTKVRVFIKIPTDDINFIKSGGKYPDGTEDKELYNSIKKNYPEYFNALVSGKTSIYLPDAVCVRRNVKSGEIYPTPYLLPALESLQHKRNLKKMDYSIAARVISAIQIVTLGSDKFPLTEDDQSLLDELKTQMLWRSSTNNLERIFQLFANHTLQIKWVFPPTEALLDEGKYAQVNNDILYSLGIPAIMTVGETQRSGSSNAEFAFLPPTEMLRALRKNLFPLIDYVYDQIREKNNFVNKPAPAFGPIKLYDPAKAAQSGEIYHNGGIISPETWADLGGFDYENEQILRKKNSELKESLGLEDIPAVPFSSPNLNNSKTKPRQSEDENTKNNQN